MGLDDNTKLYGQFVTQVLFFPECNARGRFLSFLKNNSNRPPGHCAPHRPPTVVLYRRCHRRVVPSPQPPPIAEEAVLSRPEQRKPCHHSRRRGGRAVAPRRSHRTGRESRQPPGRESRQPHGDVSFAKLVCQTIGSYFLLFCQNYMDTELVCQTAGHAVRSYMDTEEDRKRANYAHVRKFS
jgi:hypothetical protein